MKFDKQQCGNRWDKTVLVLSEKQPADFQQQVVLQLLKTERIKARAILIAEIFVFVLAIVKLFVK